LVVEADPSDPLQFASGEYPCRAPACVSNADEIPTGIERIGSPLDG